MLFNGQTPFVAIRSLSIINHLRNFVSRYQYNEYSKINHPELASIHVSGPFCSQTQCTSIEQSLSHFSNNLYQLPIWQALKSRRAFSISMILKCQIVDNARPMATAKTLIRNSITIIIIDQAKIIANFTPQKKFIFIETHQFS